jgi:penicillin-binding protein 1A
MMLPRNKRVFKVLLAVAVAAAVLMGVALGLALAATRNSILILREGNTDPALPTRILDINGREITLFFKDEKREMISLADVPPHLIQALLTREDERFFSHPGFDVQAIFRAAWNNFTGRYYSGSSTLTMNLAEPLGLTDRTDKRLRRKLKELWWAVQIERQYTKNEILEMYMNYMPFGGGTQGVEAASQYFFRHGVKDITLAESAMLVIQLARQGDYSPLRYPERARKMQRVILEQMTRLGCCTREEMEASFADYWARYDYTRPGTLTPYMERASLDKAPYFSEYIRSYLEDALFGSMDIYRDGLTVHTTLNLDYQREADSLMNKGMDDINARYLAKTGRTVDSYPSLTPALDMLGLVFNIDGLQAQEQNAKTEWKNQYAKEMNPVVDLLSAVFSLDGARSVIDAGYDSEQAMAKRTWIQGALISLDSRNGYILAMVGGRERRSTDENNRAVAGYVQPGSTFKPLYYSAAIDSRKFTAATMILDTRYAFTNPDGTRYAPEDYRGEFHGRVLLRNALADSMNIPSLIVLETIGFDAAIQRASRMLGITDPAEIVHAFPRYYPLGLGIISVSPLQMARAYATFPNQGREVQPIAVRYIEDRNGKIILEPEKELRAEQTRRGESMRIMSPQTAYIMTSILQSTLVDGTLQGKFTIADLDEHPMAGKTGTTNNWRAIWTVGFSPQITTAIWFGFDEGNRSLGKENTGGIFVGPIWARYMKAVHKYLPAQKFVKPETGLVELTVSATSGLLPSHYSKRLVNEIFLQGTEPKDFDKDDEYIEKRTQEIKDNLRTSLIQGEMSSTVPHIDVVPLESTLPGAKPPDRGNILLND